MRTPARLGSVGRRAPWRGRRPAVGVDL